MTETFTVDEINTIQWIVTLGTDISQHEARGDPPILIMRLRELHQNLIKENKDLVERYNSAAKPPEP